MAQPELPSPAFRAWRVPAEGRYWLATAVLLFVVGLLRSVNLLALLACCLLAAFALNAWAAGRGLKRLTARRRLLGPLIAGRSCPFAVEVGNAGRVVAGVRLEDRGPSHAQTWFAVRLERGTTAFRGEVTPPRRGRYAWGPVTAERGYPFGLAARRRELLAAEEAIVWPAVGSLERGRLLRRLGAAADPRDRSRARPRPHPSAQAGFYGLRPYRPGDSPRSIHWRSSARRGQLLVREFEDPPGEDLVLVLDASGRGPAFEEALSLAATICRNWSRQPGGRLALVVAAAQPEALEGPAGPALERRLLDRLALEPGGAAVDVGRLTQLLATSRLPGSAALVTAGPSRLTEVVRRALKRPVLRLDPAADWLDFYQPPSPC
jgi:uncharacterized protein (DUF58 family)